MIGSRGRTRGPTPTPSHIDSDRLISVEVVILQFGIFFGSEKNKVNV